MNATTRRPAGIHLKPGWLGTFLLILGALSQVAGAETLDEALSEMKALRAGRQTPFDEVERRAQQLLRRYSQPADQGTICWQVATIHAQSGQVRPDATIAWAKKALRLPIEPAKRLELYLAWGHAIQVKHAGARGKELAAARREAIVPYLEGLREALKHHLPDEVPERQMATLIDDPGASQKKLQRVRDQVQTAKRQMVQERMIRFRDMLTDAVAFLYSRRPFAPEQLRQLAKEKLEDNAAVERLMNAVEEAMARRPDVPALTGSRDPAQRAKPTPSKDKHAPESEDVLPPRPQQQE